MPSGLIAGADAMLVGGETLDGAARAESIRFSPGSPVSIPLVMTDTFQAYAPVSINGSRQFLFKIDSGTVTLLDPKRLSGVSLIQTTVNHFSGQNGETDAGHASNVTLSLQGLSLTLPDAVTISMDVAYPDVDKSLAGMIGAEVFESVTVEIDYPRKLLRLHDAATFHHPATGVALPFTIVNGSPAVEATLVLATGKSARGLFLLDTGCECDALAMLPFAEVEQLRQSLPEVLADLNPNIEARRAIALDLGKLHFAHPAVAIAKSFVPFLARGDVAGLIGVSLLHTFRLTFDYRTKVVWFDSL